MEFWDRGFPLRFQQNEIIVVVYLGGFLFGGRVSAEEKAKDRKTETEKEERKKGR